MIKSVVIVVTALGIVFMSCYVGFIDGRNQTRTALARGELHCEFTPAELVCWNPKTVKRSGP